MASATAEVNGAAVMAEPNGSEAPAVPNGATTVKKRKTAANKKSSGTVAVAAAATAVALGSHPFPRPGVHSALRRHPGKLRLPSISHSAAIASFALSLGSLLPVISQGQDARWIWSASAHVVS